jgi:hypothetical protein
MPFLNIALQLCRFNMQVCSAAALQPRGITPFFSGTLLMPWHRGCSSALCVLLLLSMLLRSTP